MIAQHSFVISTPGRGLINITPRIVEVISNATITNGLCNVFLHHTSASITLCENFESSVLQDLETFMQRLIPDGDQIFTHITEGPDDMPSHIRTILTQSSLTIPVINSQLALGKWQGVFLWEHRLRPHERKVTITIFD